MKKKTHAEVEQAIAAKGHQLLSQFEDVRKSLDILCPDGHRYKMRWENFNRGDKCSFCLVESEKSVRLAIVQRAFSDIGYTLLAQKWDGNTTKMDCICPEKHQISINWANFQSGVRCGECWLTLKKGKKQIQENSLKVKEAFISEGYQLLEEYKGTTTPIRFICPNGHEHSMTWHSFDKGSRCAFCSKTPPVTQEKIQRSFESEGYKLLDKYISSKKRLRFICRKGHRYSIAWDSWNQGQRCAICAGSVVTRKQVKDAFNAEGYTLLTHYKNNYEKLDFICDQGHKHKMNWASFRSGKRCIFCSKRAPVDIGFVEQFFLAAGYTPLAKYKSTKEKIPYICPEGHQYSITWHSFKSGCRCPECQGKIIKHEDVMLAFASEGYELLDVYKNSSSPLRYICPEGHSHITNWQYFNQGARCPYCAGQKPSNEQKEINVIKHRVAGLVRIYLRRQEAQKPFSISGFSGEVAKTIYEVLGNKPSDYHLDHVIPQAFFDFRDQDEIEACWHIDNLRYIPALENVSRGHRLTVEDVKKFSPSQLRLLAKASRRPKIFNKMLEKLDVGDHFSESTLTSLLNTHVQLSLDI